MTHALKSVLSIAFTPYNALLYSSKSLTKGTEGWFSCDWNLKDKNVEVGLNPLQHLGFLFLQRASTVLRHERYRGVNFPVIGM